MKRDGVILGKPEPIYVEDGAELKFDTPSGKVEFWSDQLKAKGFDPVPKYTPPAKRARGLSAADHGARAGAHVQPHAKQPAAASS